jgi:hypothetical protein
MKLYLDALLARHDPKGSRDYRALAAVVGEYNGQVRETYYGQRYVDVVLQAYALLEGDPGMFKDADNRTTEARGLRFPVDFPTGASRLTTTEIQRIQSLASSYRKLIELMKRIDVAIDDADRPVAINVSDDGLGTEDFRHSLAAARGDAIRRVLDDYFPGVVEVHVTHPRLQANLLVPDASIVLSGVSKELLLQTLPSVDDAIADQARQSWESLLAGALDEEQVQEVLGLLQRAASDADTNIESVLRMSRKVLSSADDSYLHSYAVDVMYVVVEAVENKVELLDLAEEQSFDGDPSTAIHTVMERNGVLRNRMNIIYQTIMSK